MDKDWYTIVLYLMWLFTDTLIWSKFFWANYLCNEANTLIAQSLYQCSVGHDKVDWLVQDRRNSIVHALELRLFCTNPSKWIMDNMRDICSLHKILPSYVCGIRKQICKILSRKMHIARWENFDLCTSNHPVSIVYQKTKYNKLVKQNHAHFSWALLHLF